MKAWNAFVIVTAYLLLASPFEAFVWFLAHRDLGYASWILLFNCGAYVEAAVMLVCLLALVSLARPSERTAGARIALIFVAVVVGLAASFLWQQAFQFVWKASGLYRYLSTAPDLESGIAFFKSFSVFIAIYLGIFSADLAWRWSREERAFLWLSPQAKLPGSDFVWISLMAWMAIYRLSQWLWPLLLYMPSLEGASPKFSVWSALPLVATTLACFPLSCLLFLFHPKSKLFSILLGLFAGILVPVGGFILLITTNWFAIAFFVLTLKTYNAAGVVWGFFAADFLRHAPDPPANVPAHR